MNNKITYRILFLGFLCSILFTFFFIRPLNSPWQRFIAGDGLGYYVYLPACFIYHDDNYEFKWFNGVHEKEYLSSGNVSADEHFLVKLNNKKINKYYPGLSLLWLPFFALAHACALVFQFPANGFSLPYQWGMGFASLFYLFLGLYYLRKLIFKFSGKAWVALFVPVVLFYGTHLFDYAINMNSLSHVYSFCIITAFVFYVFKSLNEEENRLYHFCLSVFLATLLVSIRPFNVLALGIVPALLFKRDKFNLSQVEKPAISHFIVGFFTIVVLCRQLYILKISTGEFFPNTYQGEPFQFLHPQLLKAAFGFQYGMFLYAPLLMFSMLGVFFYPGKIKAWILALLFILIFYLYASWWFWPITTRAMIDYYVIPALLLSALLSRITKRKTILYWAMGTALFVVYYQFKLMQFRRGALDKNYTHSQMYLKNFFRHNYSHQFAISPGSVLNQIAISQGFESAEVKGPRSDAKAFEGKFSGFIDAQNEYSPEFVTEVPEFCFSGGIVKVRYSVHVLPDEEMEEFQVYLNFKDKNGKQSLSFPFYVKNEALRRNKWTGLEFGHEFSNEELELIRDNTALVYIWNSSKKNRLYLDEAKLEFFLCDRSAEIVP